MAYDEPFRLRVMQALTSALESITIANGYKHDLASAVFRGRATFGEKDPIPMISILEPPQPFESAASPAESPAAYGPFDILIQGFAKDDRVNPTDPAYRLAADVCKCLANLRAAPAAARSTTGKATPILGIVGPTGQPAIVDLVVGKPVCRPPDEISGKAYFWASITLTMAEDLSKPYD